MRLSILYYTFDDCPYTFQFEQSSNVYSPSTIITTYDHSISTLYNVLLWDNKKYMNQRHKTKNDNFVVIAEENQYLLGKKWTAT